MALRQDSVESTGLTVSAVDRDSQRAAAVIPISSDRFVDRLGSRWLVALARGVVLWSPSGIATTLAALRSSRRRHPATDNDENVGR